MEKRQQFMQEILLRNGIRSFYNLKHLQYTNYDVFIYRKNIAKENFKNLNLNLCINSQFFKPIYKPNLKFTEFLELLFSDNLPLKYKYLYFLRFKQTQYLYSLDPAEDKEKRKYDTEFAIKEIKMWESFFSNPDSNVPTFVLTEAGLSEILYRVSGFNDLSLLEQRDIIKTELLNDFLNDFNHLMNSFIHQWNVMVLHNGKKLNLKDIELLNQNSKVFLNSHINSSDDYQREFISKIYSILNEQNVE